MIIDGNDKEKETMKAFHQGNREEGLKLQEEFAAQFREEYKKRIIAHAKRFADIMGIVKNV